MTPDPPDGRTNPSLLARIGHSPPDQRAWADFVDRYGPMVCRWCRQWRLQDADTEDVTQTVLAKLVVRLQTFRYDPTRSFRAWLKTVARHAWQDFADARRRQHGETGESAPSDLDDLAARDDLARALEEGFDLELLEHAAARVQLRVEPATWAAYRLTAVDGVSAGEAADRLGVPIARVFRAKSKVIAMLRDEVRRLEPSP